MAIDDRDADVLSIDTGVVYITPGDSFELIAHQTGCRAHLLGD